MESSLGNKNWKSAPDEAVLQAIKISSSLASTLKTLGLTISGTSSQVLKRRIERLQADTSHWDQPRKATVRCPSERMFVKDSTIGNKCVKRRIVQENLLPPKCAICSGSTWFGRVIPLELDHVNGDNRDNRLTNLRLLCPNCHSLTPTNNRGLRPTTSSVKCRYCQNESRFKVCVSCREERKAVQANRPSLRGRKRKIDWPPAEALRSKVEMTSYCEVARELGVSDNSVRKVLRNANCLPMYTRNRAMI
jgi:hypothetical protein